MSRKKFLFSVAEHATGKEFEIVANNSGHAMSIARKRYSLVNLGPDRFANDGGWRGYTIRLVEPARE